MKVEDISEVLFDQGNPQEQQGNARGESASDRIIEKHDSPPSPGLKVAHTTTEEQKPGCSSKSLELIEGKKMKFVSQGEMNDIEAEKHAVIDNIKSTKSSFSQTLKLASVMWLKAISKVLLVLTSTLLFIWIYYLPTVIFSRHLPDSMKEVIYTNIQELIESSTLWISIALAAVEVFSFQFSKNGLSYSILPGCVVHSAAIMSAHSGSTILSNIARFSQIFFICVGLYFIYKSKRPDHMTRVQEDYYSLTKDGSVSALFKGLLAFYILISFIMFNILGMYLHSSLQIQIFFRFIIFPFCFNLSKWVQMKVIYNLSKEYMNKRLIINKMCNHFIQLLGRILVSNLSTESPLSPEFILVNFAGACIEVFSTFTFEHRTKMIYRLQDKISKFLPKSICSFEAKKLVPIIPGENHREPNAMQVDNIRHEQQLRTDHIDEVDYIQDAIRFKVNHFCDDVVSEIFSIIIAPLLTYFIHPLVDDSSYQPVTSFKECFYQILIQMIFEFISDTISIAFEIHKGFIKPSDFDNWAPIRGSLLFTYSVYCAFLTHSALIFFS